ncbi:hypothetical protein ACFLZH_02470 [Patescibacteria group bacterium]
MASCKTGFKVHEDLLTYSDVDEAIKEYERVLDLAIEREDPQVCKKLPIEATYGGYVDSSIFLVHTALPIYQQESCIFEYAKTYKDANACTYPSCYTNLAIHYNDTSFCNVAESEIEENCLKGYEEWQELTLELEELMYELENEPLMN